ncbi:probable aminotransferase TAT2 [Cynara cardunculus var. scolymus]|uniref:Aminotransferase, class I/classII n=1 Tax=Cynara cardunculus var. scolymus TaxID=59895 RepID=A0A124SFU8_CYNCS|nr:probable aminotransferase TAT2 [Cynara cardunculus var. scolymus]KVI04293.1 Aminotransferase, class I/classII [Cynara cardunculus var. scolymus]
MENGSTKKKKWAFQGNPELNTASEITIRAVLAMLKTHLNQSDSRPVIPLGHGDPSSFSCFRTSPIAEDAIANALRSAKFTGYSPTVGVLPARRAVAEYLSQDLPNRISPDDVFLTVGCTQAIQTIITVLADSKANILLPKPGYPYYEAFAQSCHLEVRHFDLLPDKDWEVDLVAVEALADENTAAMVIINPGNPCGNVFTFQHLQKVAETARKLGILVIADEVYGHIAFGKNPFVPMGVFGSITPVITLGSISKRWIVPGWRLGWLIINDPNGVLKKHRIIECITQYLNISSDPPTFIQGAVPDILGKTKEDFFLKIINTIKEAANSCYEGIQDIPGVICPSEPEGSMFVMVKLDLSILENIKDDLDFCVKLAKEESIIILPGISVGLKNWLRLTFAIEPSSLEDGIKRIKAFCRRHSKKA